MGTAKLIQEGRLLDYTPSGSDVAAGDVVVVGERALIAPNDIADGVLGALDTEGLYEVPKAAGGGSAIAAGVTVYWDVAEQVAKIDDEAGANMKLGHTDLVGAGDSDATVKVKLLA